MSYKQPFLLNMLLSRSITQAPPQYSPPYHGAEELFEFLKTRVSERTAIEFISGTSDNVDDDKTRIKNGIAAQANFLQLRNVQIITKGEHRYIAFLVDYVDQSQRTMPVVSIETFESREIQGDETERGLSTAHVLVGLPDKGQIENPEYRCVIEQIHGVNRKYIETLLSRQLRRACSEWTFSVEEGTKKPKTYKYYPRFDLSISVSRSLLHAESVLSHVVFTQRSVRQNTGQETDIIDSDLVADVEIRISGKQAPEGKEHQSAWLEKLKQFYHGYKAHLYFRSVGGKTTGGEMVHDEAAAADVLLCPREMVEVDGTAKKMHASLSHSVLEAMMGLIERDEIWRRVQ